MTAFSPGDIRAEIVARRQRRISSEGRALGIDIPEKRHHPVVPFGRSPFVICEVKRRSPSKGNIDEALDPAVLAGMYRDRGIRSVSVLTEEDYFGGSLKDLMLIKNQFPDLSLLRKDFLLDVVDIEISYRAGADAVLLIASILTREELVRMYEKARQYGLSCLVEVHSPEDIEKVRPVQPEFTGINSRDLKSFRTDPAFPLKAAAAVDWPAKLVFESGIFTEEHAYFAGSSGFSGILVGEAAVRNPSVTGDLIEGLTRGVENASDSGFWRRLYGRKKHGWPLVKICGITGPEDGELAVSLGADILGFVFAPSPRKAQPECVKELFPAECLKVAVVALGRNDTSLPEEVEELLRGGFLDAVQFHGDEPPDRCFSLAFPYYKALRAKDSAVLDKASGYGCPRVLFDAYTEHAYGGTGKQVSHDFLGEASKRGIPLWLAGGISAENAGMLIKTYQPELIDASSALEKFPGKKHAGKMKDFFEEIRNAV